MNEKGDYTYYVQFGCNYLTFFMERNPEFNNGDFLKFVYLNNRADRDTGESMDIAKHEILRLAYEWIEHKWRFPNCHNRKEGWNE